MIKDWVNRVIENRIYGMIKDWVNRVIENRIYGMIKDWVNRVIENRIYGMIKDWVTILYGLFLDRYFSMRFKNDSFSNINFP
jgi:hypothetical protein